MAHEIALTSNLLSQLEAWMIENAHRYACARQYPNPRYACDFQQDCAGCLIEHAALELRKRALSGALPAPHDEHCDVNDPIIKGKPCNCRNRIPDLPDATKASLLRIRLKEDIYDDGADHHPPGILAHKGDVLEVRELLSVGAAHPGAPPGEAFIVRVGEHEPIESAEEASAPRPRYTVYDHPLGSACDLCRQVYSDHIDGYCPDPPQLLHRLKEVWKGNARLLTRDVISELNALKLIQPSNQYIWEVTDLGRQIVGSISAI